MSCSVVSLRGSRGGETWRRLVMRGLGGGAQLRVLYRTVAVPRETSGCSLEARRGAGPVRSLPLCPGWDRVVAWFRTVGGRLVRQILRREKRQDSTMDRMSVGAGGGGACPDFPWVSGAPQRHETPSQCVHPEGGSARGGAPTQWGPVCWRKTRPGGRDLGVASVRIVEATGVGV